MALGRYARIDAQNSSHFCVTVSIVAFVSTCFVGAWLAMSSSIGPLGVGITLQQFTVGMPRKAVLNNTGLHEKLDKQGNENAISLEPQTSEISASHGSESMAGEKAGNPSVSSENEKQNEISQEKEVALEKNVDSVVETRDGDSKTDLKDGLIEGNEAGNEKAISPGPQTLETMREVGSPSVSENAEVNNLSQEKDGGASPEAETSNREVPTEKNADTVVQTHDGDSKSELKDGRSDANETENDTFSQVAPWPTEAPESEKEKVSVGAPSSLYQSNYSWKVCNVTAGPDYIPCLDNIQAIKTLKSTRHYEHRERHCPDDAPTCLVPLPEGYKTPIKWPKSRDMIWFSNVPHTRLAEYKGGQNWVKVYGRYLAFPGGGTQFVFGALHYIDYLEKSVPDIAWGRRSRVVLDVGCGVASFGGYLFDRDVLTMSLAPKDEHEAQVQFALERGIPAISAVMGTQRLPFPSMVFDVIHCARCRVPWHVEGGKLLLELNRLLRPGGYFIWSATPVYRKDSVDKGIWKDMTELTESICWELVKVERDSVNRKAAAIYRKPVTNNCYEGRLKNDPPLCEESDDSSKAWYTPLQSCIHKVPTDPSKRGSHWPPQWPSRLIETPYWLKGYDVSRDITDDYNHWKHVVINMYSNESGIDWSSVRNVMDMSASYGGFAAALKDFKVWVMNVVPVNSSDTLPIIYERGLFGIYHDWCESFSTYPRSYDLLHANHLFSDLKKRCTLIAIMAEVDRILRPGGFLIVIDDTETVSEIESMAHSLQWKIKFTYSKDNNVTICVEKTMWRPAETETISSAIG